MDVPLLVIRFQEAQNKNAALEGLLVVSIAFGTKKNTAKI